MRKYKWAILLLGLALSLPIFGWADRIPIRALVLYDGEAGELQAIEIANLLGHFPVTPTTAPMASYQAGQLDEYAATIYTGDAFNAPLPDAFRQDVLTTDKAVCWLRYNLWQVAWNPDNSWDAEFTARYGFQYAGLDASGFPEVLYKGETLTRSAIDPEVGATVILDPARAQVRAVVQRPPSGADPGAAWPYAIQSGRFWYFADSPVSYLSEEDRYLAFCDLLHDILGIDHAEARRALIRIEDVNPLSNPDQLTNVADLLSAAQVPYQIATIPMFRDPLGRLSGGVPWERALADSPAVIDALRYMQDRGGQIVLHGYTHQYGDSVNPYSGLSGDDFEFVTATYHADSGYTTADGPVPADSPAWVANRVDQGLAELAAAGLSPVAWETPHYAASALDAREFGQRFELTLGRSLYWTDSGWVICQMFPYRIERDVYGQRFLPENLGNVELADPVRLPADIVRAAQKNLVVRDAWASAFFHPWLDPAYLQEIVTGVEALGYTYEAAAVGGTFPDVAPDYWAFHHIVACANAGIVNGYWDGYHPNLPVTRGQMAVYVGRALRGGSITIPTAPSTPSFADVLLFYWAYPWVEYCREQGIVGGYWDGYRPEEIVNRAQMAAYIARALAGGDAAVPAGPTTATFGDVPPSYWAYRYVEYAKSEGVVGGYWDGTYRPDEAVTRGQMAVFVARAMGLRV